MDQIHGHRQHHTYTAKIAEGITQGWVLSPFLWNTMLEKLLRPLISNEFYAIRYAYHHDRTRKIYSSNRERMHLGLNLTTNWTRNEDLTINAQKTAVISFTRRRTLEGLTSLTLQGDELEEVKYLGVMVG